MVVFGALIVLSLCGLGWYLLAGHSWNVAASNIDDTFGSMDSYTAIVYSGTDEGKEDVLEDEISDAPVTPKPEEPDAVDQPEAPEEPEVDTSSASVSAGTGTLESSSSKKPISLEDAKESYEDKNATVFSLDTLQPETYSEGTILKKGGHRFGVFSVTKPTPARLVEKQVAYFTEHKVDFIVVLTSDKAYVEDAAGIDIVISTQDEGLFVMGETINGTFYVDAPETGKVGVILISPSNVVSAKVIEEL